MNDPIVPRALIITEDGEYHVTPRHDSDCNREDAEVGASNGCDGCKCQLAIEGLLEFVAVSMPAQVLARKGVRNARR